jgi:hypothetical protein
MRERVSEWVLHCAVNQRHIRRSQPTREAALKDACSQLLEGHAVNRIVGPNETINAERVKDWCAKHKSSVSKLDIQTCFFSFWRGERQLRHSQARRNHRHFIGRTTG